MQLGHSGFNNPYLFFRILKLCFTWEAFNGSTYILNALTSPIILPPKYSSNLICVVNPEYIVLSKSWVVKHSGSCWYSISLIVSGHPPENVKLSFRPWVPPPIEILYPTPICFSFWTSNSLGIISSKFSATINNFPLTNIFRVPNLYFFSSVQLSLKVTISVVAGS